MAVTAVDLLVTRQQVDHVANRLVGIAQIRLDFLAHLAEQLIAAAENDVAGLLIVEVSQHHARAQQQQGEEHADMDMKRETSFLGLCLRPCCLLHPRMPLYALTKRKA